MLAVTKTHHGNGVCSLRVEITTSSNRKIDNGNWTFPVPD